MFRVLCHDGVAIGHLYESDTHLVFFGNRNGTLPLVRQHFPHLVFCSIKQTHSTDWTRASLDEVAADAHFTQEPGQALLIKTADCLPIMITDGAFVAAVHAGWRGLAAGILPGVFKIHKDCQSATAFVGPHIGQRSFEVGREVEQAFTRSLASMSLNANEVFFAHANPEKVYLNLALVARRQLRSLGIKKILNADYNTFANPDYHSFRRDGERAGRQFSFVALKTAKT